METVFFWASKLLWALLSPGNLLVLLAIGTWLAAALGKSVLSRRLSSVVALFVILIGFLPLGDWLIAPLEQRFPANTALPAEADGIIVLGGAISPTLSNTWGQPELNDAGERLTNFYYLANLYPEAQLVFSGGSGSITRQQDKEADSAQILFEQFGILNRAVLFESDSRNTAENVSNSKALVNPDDRENWILITSAYHMPRSVGIFCQQNWPVTPYPVDHKSDTDALLRLSFNFAANLGIFNTAIREWLGLLTYRLLGHTNTFFPNPQGGCNQSGA